MTTRRHYTGNSTGDALQHLACLMTDEAAPTAGHWKLNIDAQAEGYSRILQALDLANAMHGVIYSPAAREVRLFGSMEGLFNTLSLLHSLQDPEGAPDVVRQAKQNAEYGRTRHA